MFELLILAQSRPQLRAAISTKQPITRRFRHEHGIGARHDEFNRTQGADIYRFHAVPAIGTSRNARNWRKSSNSSRLSALRLREESISNRGGFLAPQGGWKSAVEGPMIARSRLQHRHPCGGLAASPPSQLVAESWVWPRARQRDHQIRQARYCVLLPDSSSGIFMQK
jgi:hypothetical protein